ncbi:hypothetical protein LIER_03082 [Lithospermum erythrorhizon]|uniref:non-specific serine/threonine protein kinase n=1 Tax=Lithospermum erythrorhizon TaxID=34254 RepID=A0AAV3NSM6_LITER
MHPYTFIFFIFYLSINPTFSHIHVSPQRTLLQNPNISQCPLNFTILTNLAQRSSPPSNLNSTVRCQYLRLGLRLLLSSHLRLTNSFLPPLSTVDSCVESYQTALKPFIGDFDIRATCQIRATWISQGCLNITTRDEFEARVERSALGVVRSACNQTLEGSACGACITSIVNLQASSLRGELIGNISDCSAYATIYAAAIANPYGPADLTTARCLFFIDLSNNRKLNKNSKIKIIVICVSILVVVLGVVVFGVCVYRRRLRGGKNYGKSLSSVAFSGLDSIGGSVFLKEFGLEEVKVATKNFLRENVIGSGGYGNVYRGVLSDGSEVALKRFKNLSAGGSETFRHELEIIASVRHVNLLGLIGYCTWTNEFEGHQRIIVCDLMKNGSLYDYLFGDKEGKLSWVVRRKIALGTARGLAYLHNGVQPGIIHRDVKASNILLDETFEPKVADFGLAKFTPDGVTHMSTRVSGTMGYVAPEYALYGRLTERSDVYSFGVVLLELLTGKKALMASDDGQVTLLTDWVWSLVKEGRALDVIEDMQEMDPPEVMEKYVMIAVLCSHTQLYARPTMTEVVKLLDNDIHVPVIPDRPAPFVANTNDLERSVSNTRSGPPVSSSS